MILKIGTSYVIVVLSLVTAALYEQYGDLSVNQFLAASQNYEIDEIKYAVEFQGHSLFAEVFHYEQNIDFIKSDDFISYAQSNGNTNDGRHISVSQSKIPGPGFVRDTIQPKIVSISPADGAIRVSLLPTITATFSEPMQGSTLTTSTFQIRDNEDKVVAGTVTKEPQGFPPKVIVFKPFSQLTPSMQYSVTVTTDVKDLAGNPLSNITKWYFTTTQNQASTGTFHPPKDKTGTFEPPIDTSEPSADIVSPRVVNVRPMTGATNIPVTSTVIVTFSEPVLPSTVSVTNFKLTTMGTNYGQGPFGQIPVPTVVNVPGTVTLSNDGKTATFRPAQLLMTSKDYYYSLMGVIDLAGNPLAPVPDLKGSFTTSPP